MQNGGPISTSTFPDNLSTTSFPIPGSGGNEQGFDVVVIVIAAVFIGIILIVSITVAVITFTKKSPSQIEPEMPNNMYDRRYTIRGQEYIDISSNKYMSTDKYREREYIDNIQSDIRRPSNFSVYDPDDDQPTENSAPSLINHRGSLTVDHTGSLTVPAEHRGSLAVSISSVHRGSLPLSISSEHRGSLSIQIKEAVQDMVGGEDVGEPSDHTASPT